MRYKQLYKYKKDILLIAVLILLGSLGLLYAFVFIQSGKNVEVLVAGNTVYITPLSLDQKYTINGTAGKNYLVIENNEAYLSDATCPDKLCVGMGKISKKGQSIICLPNEVVIRIVDDVNASEIDTIAY